MVLKVICSSSMFLFLPFIINVKMLSIYILIKSWAPWSNIHTSECKGPKIKPDSWHLFSYSGILIQARAINTLGRGRRETTPVGLGQAGSCQFTLKLDQIWAETMDNGGLWQILVNVCQVWHRCHCQCQAWQQWQHSHSCHMLSHVVTCLLYINLTKKGC